MQVVAGFNDHGPVSITHARCFDSRECTWRTYVVGLPASQDTDYSSGLYGHSLVAHGDLLVLFGGLLSGVMF